MGYVKYLANANEKTEMVGPSKRNADPTAIISCSLPRCLISSRTHA